MKSDLEQSFISSRTLQDVSPNAVEGKEIQYRNQLVYDPKNVSADFDIKSLFTEKPLSTSSPTYFPSSSPSKTPTASLSDKPSIYSSSIPSLAPSVSLSAPPSIKSTTISNIVVSTSSNTGDEDNELLIPVSVRSCPVTAVIDKSDLETESPEEEKDPLTAHIATFRYEIVTPVENEDLSLALTGLEESILDNAATGFLSCDEEGENANRKLQDGSGNIVRIDSDPPDVEDKLNVECIADTGVTADGDVKCTPIIGAMTFYSDCRECPYPEADILASIEAAMASGEYVDGNLVKQVNFVASRDVMVSNPATTENFKTNNNHLIGFGAAFGIIALVFVGLAFKLKKRKDRRALDHTWLEDDSSFALEPEAKPDVASNTINWNDLFIMENDEEINVTYLSRVAFSNLKQLSFRK